MGGKKKSSAVLAQLLGTDSGGGGDGGGGGGGDEDGGGSGGRRRSSAQQNIRTMRNKIRSFLAFKGVAADAERRRSSALTPPLGGLAEGLADGAETWGEGRGVGRMSAITLGAGNAGGSGGGAGGAGSAGNGVVSAVAPAGSPLVTPLKIARRQLKTTYESDGPGQEPASPRLARKQLEGEATKRQSGRRKAATSRRGACTLSTCKCQRFTPNPWRKQLCMHCLHPYEEHEDCSVSASSPLLIASALAVAAAQARATVAARGASGGGDGGGGGGSGGGGGGGGGDGDDDDDDSGCSSSEETDSSEDEGGGEARPWEVGETVPLEECVLWFYLDAKDHIKGPHSTRRMRMWYEAGYLPPDVRVRPPGAVGEQSALLYGEEFVEVKRIYATTDPLEVRDERREKTTKKVIGGRQRETDVACYMFVRRKKREDHP